MIGHTISRNRILEKLGGGGMNVVYKAAEHPVVALSLECNIVVAKEFLLDSLTPTA